MCKIVAIVLCSVATAALGQVGRNHVFDFLQLPAHARLAALGGVNVSLADRDINFFHNNPALAGDTLNGVASAGYRLHVADVGNALFTYAHNFPGWGQLIAGVRHMRYGNIQGFDESGAQTLEYASGETAIVLGRTHQIGHVRLGAAVKGIFSNIAGYRANALMMDLGGVFQHPDKDITIGLALKNMGVVLSDHSQSSTRRLPFDVQAGVTLKPEHMPVRFSVTGYNLAHPRLLQDGSVNAPENAPLLKNIVSHLNAGAEILLHRNVNGMLGYNYLLHHALKAETGNAAAGFTYGFSVLVKPVEFIFGRSAYSVGNAGYSFTLSTNTNQLLKKRKL